MPVPTPAAPALLTSAELAARWSVHPQSLANDRSAGRGLPFVKIGARVRYRLADIEAFETAALVRPVSA